MALRMKLAVALANLSTPYTLPLPSGKEEVKMLYGLFVLNKTLYMCDTAATSIAFDLCIVHNFKRDIGINIAQCKSAILKGSREALEWLVDYYKNAADNQSKGLPVYDDKDDYDLQYRRHAIMYRLSDDDYENMTVDLIKYSFGCMNFDTLSTMAMLPLKTWTLSDGSTRPIMKVPDDRKREVEHILGVFITIMGSNDAYSASIYKVFSDIAGYLQLSEAKIIPVSAFTRLYYSTIFACNCLQYDIEQRSKVLMEYINRCNKETDKILALLDTDIDLEVSDQHKPECVRLITSLRNDECDDDAVDRLAVKLGV